MSVIVAKRNLSKIQYVESFRQLQLYTQKKLEKIPKRKRKWLRDPIAKIMNETFDMIIEIANDYFLYGIKILSKQDSARLIIDSLLSLQKPLLSLWNIENYLYPTKKMEYWCKLINEEVRQIAIMGNIELNNYDKMFILDYTGIEQMNFLSNMCDLHWFVHSKLTSLNEHIRATGGLCLIKLIDEALFRVFNANRIYPTTKEEYELRAENISIAIKCLKEMEIPMLSLFTLELFSEGVMRQWVKQLNEEMKMLNGLQKSDKTKFKNLLM